MIDVGIVDGDVIVCIASDNQHKPSDGGLVIVERRRSGLVELSARRVFVFKDRTEFAACRENGDIYKPIIVHHRKRSENESVKIVALIRRRTGVVK
jgi:hypothetical protein